MPIGRGENTNIADLARTRVRCRRVEIALPLPVGTAGRVGAILDVGDHHIADPTSELARHGKRNNLSRKRGETARQVEEEKRK